jgi:hypothetical protein
MDRKRSLSAAFLAALGLSALFLPGRALAQSETGMSGPAIYSQFVTGDFVVGSNNTRQFVTAPATLSQTNPFNITLAGIPAGATVVQAYANWTYQTQFAAGVTGEPNVTIDGNAVTGTLTGTATPDLNWGTQGSHAYTADITSIVAANGNGAYTIHGAVDSATTDAYGEGMTILAVWSKAGSPLKNVDVYSGLTTDDSGPNLATFNFDTPYKGGSTNFFVNQIDGQGAYTNQGLINGINMGAGLSGIGPTGNTFEGLVGLNPTDNLYDQVTGDSSSYMYNGEAALTVQGLGAGNTGGSVFVAGLYTDHVGTSFGAISFVPEPSAVALVIIGASFLLLRRRTRRLA